MRITGRVRTWFANWRAGRRRTPWDAGANRSDWDSGRIDMLGIVRAQQDMRPMPSDWNKR